MLLSEQNLSKMNHAPFRMMQMSWLCS